MVLKVFIDSISLPFFGKPLPCPLRGRRLFFQLRYFGKGVGALTPPSLLLVRTNFLFLRRKRSECEVAASPAPWSSTGFAVSSTATFSDSEAIGCTSISAARTGEAGRVTRRTLQHDCFSTLMRIYGDSQ